MWNHCWKHRVKPVCRGVKFSDMFVEFIFTFRLWLFVTRLQNEVFKNHENLRGLPATCHHLRRERAGLIQGLGIFGWIYIHENHRLQLENKLLEKEKHPEKKTINSIGKGSMMLVFEGVFGFRHLQSRVMTMMVSRNCLHWCQWWVSRIMMDHALSSEIHPTVWCACFFLQDYFLHLLTVSCHSTCHIVCRC